jgi:predicted transcriptional regulator of viral defense system
LINATFLKAGGTPDQFRVALDRAMAKGWLERHESGTYVKFTQAGAELFA